MRIMLLTQWFDPEPTLKGLKFSKSLVERGFEVDVVTGFPNYPGGKLYPGYSIRWLQKDIIDGVNITRLPLYPSHDNSAIKRVLNYVSFAVSSLFYCLFFARRCDVIYAYHPPLTVGFTASIIRLFRRIPVVYDIQDMWPDTLRATGMINNPKILKAIEYTCAYVYRQVDKIVVLSPGFKRLLVERGVPDKKIEIIYNWANNLSVAEPTDRAHNVFPVDGRFRVLFAGNLGKAQALDTVLDAAQILAATDSKATFVLMGGGLDLIRLKNRVVRMDLRNVDFLPQVPMTDVGAYLHSADVLLVHLRKDPLFEVTIPSKTQAYMVVGKPILMAVIGDAADIISKSGGGVVVQSESATELASAVVSLENLSEDERKEIGKRAIEYYQRNLSEEIGVNLYASIILDLGKK